MTDMINHPPHYTGHPSGLEAIDIAEQLGFNLGSAWKYICRAGKKNMPAAEDYAKAAWYCRRAATGPDFDVKEDEVYDLLVYIQRWIASETDRGKKTAAVGMLNVIRTKPESTATMCITLATFLSALSQAVEQGLSGDAAAQAAATVLQEQVR